MRGAHGTVPGTARTHVHEQMQRRRLPAVGKEGEQFRLRPRSRLLSLSWRPFSQAVGEGGPCEVGTRRVLGLWWWQSEGTRLLVTGPGALCGAPIRVLRSLGAAAVSLPRMHLASAAVCGNSHGCLVLNDPEFHT